MSFTVQDIINDIPQLVAGRQYSAANIADKCRKTVLELTQDYSFQELQIQGPVIAFNQGQILYPFTYFYPSATPSDEKTVPTRIIDIFLYSNPGQFPTDLTISTSGANSGYNLKYRTKDTMELEFNIQAIPIHWTRFQGNILISYAPNSLYYAYATLQQQNPFPNARTVDAGDDVILMDDSWQDIVGMGTAQRLTQGTRLNDMSNQFRIMLYGDPEAAPGTQEGLGLLKHRTSTDERDQTSGGAVKAMRMYVRPYQKGGW